MGQTSAIIGVSIFDITRSGTRQTPFGRCLMFGSGTVGAVGMYTITSLADFDTKIGAASASRKHVKTFFDNLGNPGIELLFYKVQNVATAAVIADYTTAVDAVNPLAYNGGVVIAPEVYESLVIAQRKTFWDKLESFCDFLKGSIWVHFCDINPTPANPSESDLISEKNGNYTSTMSGFCFYGKGFRQETGEVAISASPAMAAVWLTNSSLRGLYRTPAKLPLTGYSRLVSNFINYDTIIKAGINPIILDDGIFQSFSAVGANNKPGFYHFVSVVCYKAVAFFCANAMKAFVNAEVAGEDNILSIAQAVLQTELQNCWQIRKLLTGQTNDEAYKVTTTVVPGTTVVENDLIFEVELKPSYSNQGVVLRFINVLT
jgi:hypothetical protein